MPQTQASATQNMAASLATINIPPMEMKGDLSANWTLFSDCWSDYITANGLKDEEDTVLSAKLHSVMGIECRKILKHLPMQEADRNKPDKIIEALKNYFEPQKNVIYERYKFNSCSQEANEGIDAYVTKLRRLASSCEYGQLEDQMIWDRIVIGTRSNTVRGRLLHDNQLNLNKAIEICRADEAANLQLQSMGSSSTSKEASLHYALSKKPITRQAKPRTKTCKYCGKDPHDKSKCPAKGDICAKCGKANHWAKVCRSAGSRKSKRDQQSQMQTRSKQHKQQVHQLENEENSDKFSDESLFHIQQVRGKQYFSILNINNTNVKCQLDSGSTTNCMPYNTLQKIMKCESPEISPSRSTLNMFNKMSMKPLGSTKLAARCNGQSHNIHFEILDEAPCTILSGSTCEAFNLIQISPTGKVYQMDGTSELTKDYIVDQYKDVFTGLGKLPGHCHIDLDPTVKPVQHTPHRVPIPLKKELKLKIQ